MGKMKNALVRLAKKVTGKDVANKDSISNVLDFMADNYVGGSGNGGGTGHLILGDDALTLFGNEGSGCFDTEKLKQLFANNGVDLSAFNIGVSIIPNNLTTPSEIDGQGLIEIEAVEHPLIRINGDALELTIKDYVSLEDLLDSNANVINGTLLDGSYFVADNIYKIYIQVEDLTPGPEVIPGGEVEI